MKSKKTAMKRNIIATLSFYSRFFTLKGIYIEIWKLMSIIT